MEGYTLAVYIFGSLVTMTPTPYLTAKACATAAVEVSDATRENGGKAICINNATGEVVFDTELI